MPPPDFSRYIPVVCLQSDSRYNGSCFMEPILKVRVLNGVAISKERSLTKADFKTGDEVVIRFSGKDYRGVVDFSRDEESLVKRADSQPPPYLLDPSAARCAAHAERV